MLVPNQYLTATMDYPVITAELTVGITDKPIYIDKIQNHSIFDLSKRNNQTNIYYPTKYYSIAVNHFLNNKLDFNILDWIHTENVSSDKIEYENNIIPSFEISFEEMLFVCDLEAQLSEKIKDLTMDQVLYFLLDSIENLLLKREFGRINILFEYLELNKYDTEILVCILTASFPWKKMLYKREKFYNLTKTIIYNRYSRSEADAILVGLE